MGVSWKWKPVLVCLGVAAFISLEVGVIEYEGYTETDVPMRICHSVATGLCFVLPLIYLILLGLDFDYWFGVQRVAFLDIFVSFVMFWFLVITSGFMASDRWNYVNKMICTLQEGNSYFSPEWYYRKQFCEGVAASVVFGLLASIVWVVNGIAVFLSARRHTYRGTKV